MNSERTRLSGAAIGLISTVACNLGTDFEPLVSTYLPPLLALCGRANKVVMTRARSAILAVIDNTQLPGILHHLLQNVQDKAATLRLVVAEATLACVNSYNPPDLEKESRARDIEAIIRSTATDSNPDVRKVARQIFAAYQLVLPNRVDSFIAPLTTTIRKYLDIKPKLGSSSNTSSRAQSPTRPSSRTMNSVMSTSSNSQSQSKAKLASSTGTRAKAPARSDSNKSTSSTSWTTATATRPDPSLSKSGPARVRVERSGVGDAGLMPPPEYIPMRAAPNSSGQPLHTARSMTAINDRERAARGAASVPARPPSASAQLSSSGPVRLAKSVSQSVRPTAPTTSANQIDKHTVSGGARRILLPDPAPSETKAAATKPKSDGASRQATVPNNSTVSVTRSEPASKASQLPAPLKRHVSRAQLTTATKATERPRPVSGLPKTGDTKRTTEQTRSVHAAEVKGKGLTQPTLAQLARMKPPVERKATAATAKSAKPSWGMGAAPKKPATVTTAKTVAKPPLNSAKSVSSKASSQTAPGVRSKPPSRVATPALVPLPASPTPCDQLEGAQEVDVKAPALIPLPISPDPEVAEPVEETEATVVAEPCPVDDAPGDDSEATNLPVETADSAQITLTPDTPGCEPEYSTPQATRPALALSQEKTPISALLSSIQQGFLMTPATPLSPPSGALARAADGTLFMGKRGEAIDDDEIAFGLGMLGIGPNMGSLKSMGSLVRRDTERPALSDVELNQ
ncbi:hypothetical protein HGRIS_013247 [Hohenbuehelia grisea]|uniref:CLASP N-terminal domain-containing protein n=1 Tax=Hohenbuehelia grisea TaxID=104357 RepID=A0ABR3IUZ5_9AGAR